MLKASDLKTISADDFHTLLNNICNTEGMARDMLAILAGMDPQAFAGAFAIASSIRD